MVVLQAPGGNDDGSGTISLLAIARRIKELGVKFHSTVEVVAFAGEEQGLCGSKAYARMSSFWHTRCSLTPHGSLQESCAHGKPM